MAPTRGNRTLQHHRKPGFGDFHARARAPSIATFLDWRGLAVTAIAYLQPATRADLSRLVGKQISRDIIGRLTRLDLIDAGLRAPEPGAPFAYVTTKKFLEVFGLASLRDLPDIERLEEAGLLERPPCSEDLDGVLGLCEEEAPFEDEANQ